MSGGLSRLADVLAVEQPSQDTYGTATYLRTDQDGTAWVRLAGSDTETPANGGSTVDAKEGDIVAVRQSGTRLYITGNGTTPAVGQQQVVEIVSPVERMAEAAGAYAQSALDSATTAAAAAESAVADAARAEGKADEATAAASTANTAAQSALLNLSTVEDVVDTLTWITKHGTMTLTTDTTVDPSKVYFVPDASGQYVVGGSTYAIVQNPTDSGLSTYYELTIDKSVENYIATHVSVTDEGLWLTPTSSNGYRVLIATGAGTTYTTAGTYIIDNSGNIRAIIGETITLGNAADGSVVTIDSDSMDMMHGTDEMLHFGYGEGAAASGTANAPYYTIGRRAVNSTVGNYSVAEGDSTTASGYASHAEGRGTTASRYQSHAEGVYTEASGTASHAEGMYTEASGVGSHAEGSSTQGYKIVASDFGSHAEGDATYGDVTASARAAHAEGSATTASGAASHAEGTQTTASGANSHAEGQATTASGANSHAGGFQTIAASYNQTALGRYNVADANSTYAVIVGNGASSSARSNALTVDWDGTVETHKNLNLVSDTADSLASTRSATSYESGIYAFDMNGKRVFYCETMYGADGRVQRSFAVQRDSVTNGLWFWVNADGTRGMSLSDASMWRTALALGSLALKSSLAASDIPSLDASKIGSGKLPRTKGGTDVTGRQSSTVTLSDSGATTNACWHNGIVATVTLGALHLTSALADSSSRTVGTVPSGYRPVGDVTAVCGTNANASTGKVFVIIHSSGTITLYNRSGASLGTGVNMYLTVTYAI